MRCLYCGNELALLKKLTGGGEFCSEAHRQKYQEEYNRLALTRLLQAQPPAAERRPLESAAGKVKRPAVNDSDVAIAEERAPIAARKTSNPLEGELPQTNSSDAKHRSAEGNGSASNGRSKGLDSKPAAPDPPKPGFLFDPGPARTSDRQRLIKDPLPLPVQAPSIPVHVAAMRSMPRPETPDILPLLLRDEGWNNQTARSQAGLDAQQFVKAMPSIRSNLETISAIRLQPATEPLELTLELASSPSAALWSAASREFASWPEFDWNAEEMVRALVDGNDESASDPLRSLEEASATAPLVFDMETDEEPVAAVPPPPIELPVKASKPLRPPVKPVATAPSETTETALPASLAAPVLTEALPPISAELPVVVEAPLAAARPETVAPIEPEPQKIEVAAEPAIVEPVRELVTPCYVDAFLFDDVVAVNPTPKPDPLGDIAPVAAAPVEAVPEVTVAEAPVAESPAVEGRVIDGNIVGESLAEEAVAEEPETPVVDVAKAPAADLLLDGVAVDEPLGEASREELRPEPPPQVEAENEPEIQPEPVADLKAPELAPEAPAITAPAPAPKLPRVAQEPLEVALTLLMPAAAKPSKQNPPIAQLHAAIAVPSLDALPVRPKMFYAARPEAPVETRPESLPEARIESRVEASPKPVEEVPPPPPERPAEPLRTPQLSRRDQRRNAQLNRQSQKSSTKAEPAEVKTDVAAAPPPAVAQPMAKVEATAPAPVTAAPPKMPVQAPVPVQAAEPKPAPAVIEKPTAPPSKPQPTAKVVAPKPPTAEKPAESASQRDALEGLRLSLEASGSNSPLFGAWSRMNTQTRIAVSAGLLIATLVAGYFLKSSLGATSGPAVARAANIDAVGPNLTSGVNGWSPDWAGPGAARQISLFRPSLGLADYRIEFQGQIESKTIGWIFRASDAKNYYGTRIEMTKPGLTPTVVVKHFTMLQGTEVDAVETPLPFPVHVDTLYKVRTDVYGGQFRTYLQGTLVDSWSDDRLKSGGFGLLNERGDRSQVRMVQLFELKAGR